MPIIEAAGLKFKLLLIMLYDPLDISLLNDSSFYFKFSDTLVKLSVFYFFGELLSDFKSS